MAFDFDKIKDTLVSAGKEVESMAKDVSAVAKIKMDIHNKEVFLENSMHYWVKHFTMHIKMKM